MTWQPIDLNDDDGPWFTGDPAELRDAFLTMLGELHPPWHRRAACRGKGTATFFPERGQHVRPAKEMCETCPVRSECFEASQGEKFGIWGGLSERQRRQERSRSRRAA